MQNTQENFQIAMKAENEAELFYTNEEDGTPGALQVYINKPKKICLPINWLCLWQKDAEGTGISLIEQAADRRFNETDFRVRDYLVHHASIGNYVNISQTEAARYLKIAQSNISASIKKMFGWGLILQGPDKGKFKTYQINPAFVYSGRLMLGINERKNAIKLEKEKNG